MTKISIKEIVFQKKTNLILKKVNEHKYIYMYALFQVTITFQKLYNI